MTASRRSDKGGESEKATASGPEGATPPPVMQTGSGKVRALRCCYLRMALHGHGLGAMIFTCTYRAVKSMFEYVNICST